jgi:plasmid stability protein
MVGNNNSKILTVSYGTFSCTLEGFDDSFGMMKAIAEYFRDLAADDRFFGAEPPTPDAAMLAKIAENEISRRVEARTENGGLVLRPYQQVPHQPEAEAEPVVTPVTDLVEEDDTENAEPFFTPPVARAINPAKSIAERLERIRAAAHHEVDEAELTEDPVAAADETEEETPQPIEVAEDETPDVDIEDLTEEPEADWDDEELAATAVDDAEDVDAPEQDQDIDDDVDALLAAVAEEANTAPAFDTTFEDEADQVDDLDSMVAIAEDALDTDMELEGLLDSFDSDDDVEDLEESDEIEDSDDDFLLEDESEDLTADHEEPEETPTLPEDFRAQILHVKGGKLAEVVDIAFDEDDYEDQTPAVDSATLDAIFADDSDEKPADGPASSLLPEDEADLLRELAAVEASDADDTEDDWYDALLDEDEVEITDGENLFTKDPKAALDNAQDLSSLLAGSSADEEVSRLMSEAEEQMAQPEVNRRRNTIARLKAAVAAKRTDGNRIPSGNDTEASSVTYREDLAVAAPPATAPALPAPAKRPNAAPLRLVAEQKIVPQRDDADHAPTTPRPTAIKPVRPRRVTVGGRGGAAAQAVAQPLPEVTEAPQATPARSFQAFAADHDVEKLPELLEAAASYITFVEGREKFSRPQVTTHVRVVMGPRYSREDGLRAFGQLLREGKLLRLEGGRFTVSDGIGFQP